MAIEGTLQEMNFATLAQTLVQGDASVRVRLQQEHKKAVVYIENHQVCHAELVVFTENDQVTIVGESAIYQLLTWEFGKFIVDRNQSPPQQTISVPWDYLLMEGLRQIDEQHTIELDESAEEDLQDMLKELSAQDAYAIQQLINQQEKEKMASKSELLNQILNNVVTNSTDIVGAAIVDNDGLLLASRFSNSVDGNRVAAVSAGLISLASRSAQQLNQGNVKQTLIQAENGNIIAVRANAGTSFVALTALSVNLGMVFMECKDAAKAVADAI